MRRNIDFSKLTARQIVFFALGLALSITGLVLSVILYASSLYKDVAAYPVSMTSRTAQPLCTGCAVETGQSLWLRLPNRQIEYTDIKIDAAATPNDGTPAATSETGFVVVNFRNQFGGKVYYRLMDLSDLDGRTADLMLTVTGSDTLDLPAEAVVRTAGGVQVNAFYIGLILVGTLFIILGTRRRRDPS